MHAPDLVRKEHPAGTVGNGDQSRGGDEPFSNLFECDAAFGVCSEDVRGQKRDGRAGKDYRTEFEVE